MTNTLNEAVLTEAVLEASNRLGLDDATLSAALELPAQSVESLKAGAHLDSVTNAYKNSAKLIQLYEALVGLVGTDQQHLRGWLTSENKRWSCTPLHKLRARSGLDEVMAYLQSAANH